MGYGLLLFEWKGYAILFATFVFTLLFYYSYSADWYYSFYGAFFSAVMVWGSYLVIRMIYLASRS